jgi:hypothetical protein
MTTLRDALVSQAPSQALQRSAHAEIAKLDARVRALELALHGMVERAATGAPVADSDIWHVRDVLRAGKWDAPFVVGAR